MRYTDPMGNLRRLTIKSADDIIGLQAHHGLPQEYRGKFLKLTPLLNIDNPKYAAWVDSMHQAWSKVYNLEWDAFLKTMPSEAILDFLYDISRRYNIDIFH
jgi:hypothetical protein